MSFIKQIFIKVFQGLFEYLLLLPLLLIIGIHFIDEAQRWYWLFGLIMLFTIGVSIRMMLAKQKWWLFSLLSIVIGVSSAAIFHADWLFMIVLVIIHTAIIYRGMMYGSRTWGDLLPLSFLWISGFGIYFISYFLFRYIEILNPYLNYITTFGITLIIMTMFVANSDHLKNTTFSKEKKPFINKTIKNQNRIFLVITIGLIVLITNGQSIREGFWNAIRMVLVWILQPTSDSRSEEISEEPIGPPGEMELPFDEPAEPSAFAKFIELIAIYFTAALLVVAAIVLVLLLIKKTRTWLINRFWSLIEFLKGIMHQMIDREESGQYVEEKESVFDWKEWREEQQSKAKGFVQKIFRRKPSWNALSNQQKVRFVFQRFLVQEVDLTKWKKTATPREILEELKLSAGADDVQIEQLRMAYEQTRYGERDIDEQIIKEIYTLIDKK